MAEFRNINKQFNSMKESNNVSKNAGREDNYAQNFKLAKESLIISKLEVKFEKMKKNKKIFMPDDEHNDETDHQLPNDSIKAQSNQFFMNYNHETQIKDKKEKKGRSKVKSVEINADSAKTKILTENNVGFNENYKLVKIESNKKVKKVDNEQSNTDLLRDDKEFTIIRKARVSKSKEKANKKAKMVCDNIKSAKNTGQDQNVNSSKSINSSNLHLDNKSRVINEKNEENIKLLNEQTKCSQTKVNLSNTNVDTRVKKESSTVSVSSNKLDVDNSKPRNLKPTHQRKRSTSCISFLCN